MPVDKGTYNKYHCHYIADPVPWVWDGTGYNAHAYSTYEDFASIQPVDHDGVDNYAGWDIALSETWGPPYDATSKLWDMTHGLSGAWCSQEADAPAVKNMETMTIEDFVTKIRGTGSPRSGGMSNIRDPVEREAVYTDVLTTLHDEAIFLPLTAKRQTAVTNTGVSGFKFGFMEFDLPLANLYPTPSPSPPPPPPPPPPSPPPPPPTAASKLSESSDSLTDGEIAGVAVGGVLAVALLAVSVFVCVLVSREKKGQPVFSQVVSTNVNAEPVSVATAK